MSKISTAKKEILELIDKVTVGDKLTLDLYKKLFAKQTDAEFTKFMEKLRDGDILNIIVSVDISKIKITVDNNIKLAKEMGYPLFQHTITKGDDKLPDTVSKYKEFIQLMPIKRTKHTVDKGVSFSSDGTHVDSITGQPSGVSQSAKTSGPEIKLLGAMGLTETQKELTINRSDNSKFNVANSILKQYGSVSGDDIERYSETTQTTKTLNAYLRSMHLQLTV